MLWGINMKLAIDSKYIITHIDLDKVENVADVYFCDVESNDRYIASYDIEGDMQLNYDMVGGGEVEVSLYDTEIKFNNMFDFVSGDVIDVNVDIKRIAKILEEYIIEELEQERIDNLGDY